MSQRAAELALEPHIGHSISTPCGNFTLTLQLSFRLILLIETTYSATFSPLSEAVSISSGSHLSPTGVSNAEQRLTC